MGAHERVMPCCEGKTKAQAIDEFSKDVGLFTELTGRSSIKEYLDDYWEEFHAENKCIYESLVSDLKHLARAKEALNGCS